MKAYYEYEDGTFWAVRTEGNDCFTIHGSKYRGLEPELMLEAEGVKFRGLMSNTRKTTYADPAAAEIEGQKTAQEKSVGSLKEDAEFWRIAIEINALLLFFVPDMYKTKELYALASHRNGLALRYVPAKTQDQELCMQAVKNNPRAIEFVDEKFKTRELCEKAIRMNGDTL